MLRNLLIAIILLPVIFLGQVSSYPGGGSAAILQDKASFAICHETSCATGTNLTNEYVFVNAIDFVSCRAFAKVAPTGANLIIDINLNGTTIFGGTKLVIAATAQTGTQETFAIVSAAVADRLTVDIDQIGSTLAGETVSVVCKMEVQ